MTFGKHENEMKHVSVTPHNFPASYSIEIMQPLSCSRAFSQGWNFPYWIFRGVHPSVQNQWNQTRSADLNAPKMQKSETKRISKSTPTYQYKLLPVGTLIAQMKRFKKISDKSEKIDFKLFSSSESVFI